MDSINILTIIVIVLCAILYGVILYFKVRGNIFGAASELVALAEQSGLTGPEKMNQVVTALHEKIPAPLKKVFTPDRIRKIAQVVFEWMRKYADEYKKNSTGSTTSEDMKTDVAVAAADLTIELLKLTVPELKKKAEEYGIELDGLTRKDEILRAIMEAVLKKA